jgi:hypothetical protein
MSLLAGIIVAIIVFIGVGVIALLFALVWTGTGE